MYILWHAENIISENGHCSPEICPELNLKIPLLQSKRRSLFCELPWHWCDCCQRITITRECNSSCVCISVCFKIYTIQRYYPTSSKTSTIQSSSTFWKRHCKQKPVTSIKYSHKAIRIFLGH